MSPIKVAMLLGVALSLALGQLLFKAAAERLPAEAGLNAQTLLALLGNWQLALAVSVYAASTALWVFALKGTPLTQAYPFVAVAMVLVPLAAVVVLGETLTLSLVLGTLLVVTGVLVVAWGF